jgi:hypothetical protein
MNEKNPKGRHGPKLSEKELVTVAFAEDLELARRNKALLEENGIPAHIRESADSAGTPQIAILVREEDLDQAHALIASHASFEEFFDVFFRGGPELLDDLLDEED